MSSIDVTPAGNGLFQVDIRDPQGASRHEISVPDALLEQIDTDGIALQDLVLASVDYLTTRQGRQDLDPQISLGEVAERYDGFVDDIVAMARERATGDTPPTGIHADAEARADGEQLTGDDALVSEVREEQATGQATPGQDRF